MPLDLQETRMPGVGVKYTLRLDDGGRIAVILHNDGKREIYWFRHAHDDEPRAVITLDDDEARQLGAVIGGAYERPKIVEDLEMALGELQIEWVPVPDTSPWIGKTLAEAAFRRARASPSSRSCASRSRSPGPSRRTWCNAGTRSSPSRRRASTRPSGARSPARTSGP